MEPKKALLFCLLTVLIILFFVFDLNHYFSLDYFKEKQLAITAYSEQNPLTSALLFFLVYIAITGLSLPGATILTLAGGAIFGFLWGTILVSFASSIGATLAFLASRFLFREAVQTRFARSLKPINEGIENEGAFYLFTLRLVPAFPFFVINLVMGLTPITTLSFYWVSQIGMLAATLVFVNAGTQIAQVDSLSGILSPGLLLSFILLGVFPLIAKKALAILRTRKVLQGIKKPKNFDRNLIVIGAGSAGLVSAYIAAAVKAKVTLIEKHKMGGDCLNTGCVPSKALLRSAKFLHQVRRASEFGFKSAHAEFDFATIMARVQRVIKTIEPHDSVARYEKLGVDCITGEARIKSPYAVEVNGQTLTTRNIVIATGACPLVPPIPGLEKVGYLTSDTIWDLRELPGRFVVLGGGPIGCELTQAFARLGSKVIQVEMLPKILSREDPDISQIILNRFRDEGIDVRLQHKAKGFRIESGQKIMDCEYLGREVHIEFDQILVALGRSANSAGFGLEELSIPLNANKTIATNAYLQTVYPSVYACGDVAGPYQFTHVSAHQAWYATVNALFGRMRKYKVDYSIIPWATFTDPEVARVGLNETDAKAQGIPYEVTTYGIEDLDRAITEEAAHGLVKVLSVPGKDKILGATIVGEHAGDLIAEYVTAMRHNIGLNKILGTVHIYPTLSEANKYAAGEWKKAHAPDWALKLLSRYHAWELR